MDQEYLSPVHTEQETLNRSPLIATYLGPFAWNRNEATTE